MQLEKEEAQDLCAENAEIDRNLNNLGTRRKFGLNAACAGVQGIFCPGIHPDWRLPYVHV